MLGHLAAVTIVTTLAVGLVSREASFLKGIWAIYFLTWVAAVTAPWVVGWLPYA